MRPRRAGATGWCWRERVAGAPLTKEHRPLPPRIRLPPLAVRRHVTPEDLDVAPALVGLPLAAPSRRLAAIGVDVAVVGLLSSLGNIWVLLACALMLALQTRWRAWAPSGVRRPLAWALAITLLAVGAEQAWTERNAPADAEDRADPDDAVALPALPPELAALAASSASSAPPISAAEQIAELQDELSEARRPKPFRLRTEIGRWSDELGIGFGWAIVYFSMVPVWLPGQTLGKKLFGLRVVELTGKPLTAMVCLKRYGGYAAGMATGMLGFAQVLWDSNRQAIQDKTAHTVVIDLRGERRRTKDAPP